MATITPTRFGLKYGPIPTLALEYEEDLGLIENEDGTRSLYVFKETSAEPASRSIRKKLHVVELPQLTVRSEPLTVVRQLQKDNRRFLGPSVVKEQQLQRLLQQLLDHLPPSERTTIVAATKAVHVSASIELVQTTATATREADAGDEEEDDQQLEESAMEESVVEASISMETSRADEHDKAHTQDATSIQQSLPRTGKFITQAESDGDDDAGNDDHDQDEEENADPAPPQPPTSNSPPPTSNDQAEAVEDEKKKKALKSESDASEDEDVQSEELEYFSEDGSDEDSF